MRSQQLKFNFNEDDTSWVWGILEKHDREMKNRKKRKNYLRPF